MWRRSSRRLAGIRVCHPDLEHALQCEGNEGENTKQTKLAEAIGSTQRAISYYENDGGYPPVPVVAQLAEALGVSADELLGVGVLPRRAAVRASENAETRRLWKKFQQLLTLPEKDQRAVMRLVNSLVGAKGE